MRIKINLSSISSPAPLKAKVFKGAPVVNFAEYTRGLQHLKHTIKDKFGRIPRTNVIPLCSIIDLYTLHNIRIADSYTPNVSISDLDSIKEYDRQVDTPSKYTGKLTEAEYANLKEDIRDNGINRYGIVELIRNKSNNTVSASLVEGNHRLSIAKKLGIKSMPIMVYYV